MIKEIYFDNIKIEYNLNIKKVKNINLRIKPDGEIMVSASRCVPVKTIEEFLKSKSDFILKALKKYNYLNEKPLVKYFDEEEIRDIILKICEDVYPYFEKQGVKYPKIKFKKMISRWGSCNYVKGILTFNTYLLYAPRECIEYVVLHEFTHFLKADHSKEFYEELEKVCPDWKIKRKILKDITLKGR